MKTDRFSPASVRIAAVVLAGLLLLASQPAAGQIVFRLGKPGADREAASMRLALVLAATVGRVQERFDKNRSELRTVKGPDGKPAYLREEVAGLIARTGEDLGQAILQARKSGMEPLRAWSDEEIRLLQEKLAALAAVAPGRAAASSPGLFPPRAGAPVAVFASLERFSLPRLARAGTAAPRQETVATGPSDRLLDQLGSVVGRLVLLAERKDLEVKLWVGSPPARHAKFSFWPQGKIQGSAPKPIIIRTDGERDRVLRGLYAYRAAWTRGRVTELVQYPLPAGSPGARDASERLDLVNDTSFFCCRFDEKYCHHVDDEKACRP